MSAGLPGLGLSGLFVLMCALAMPLASRGDRQRSWPRLFVFALVLAAVAVLAWELLAMSGGVLHAELGDGALHGTSIAHSGREVGHAPFAGSFFGAPVLVLSLGILVTILVVPELLLWTIGTRPTPALPPVPYLGEQTEDATSADTEPDED